LALESQGLQEIVALSFLRYEQISYKPICV
jgi:hypothetical protein